MLGVLRMRRGCGRAACHQYGVLYLYCVQCQACDEGVMMIRCILLRYVGALCMDGAYIQQVLRMHVATYAYDC